MWKRILIWFTAILVVGLLAFVIIELTSDQSYRSAWTVFYNGPAANNSYDEPSDIAIDSKGHIYVTGFSMGNDSSTDYCTIKYDKDGNRLWVTRYNWLPGGNDKAYAMFIDNSDNIYITGKSEGNVTYDVATVKYDAGGNEVWAARYNGLLGRMDEAYSITGDIWGNVYITGYTIGKGTDYLTIKYDSNGTEQWAAQYNGSKSMGDCANAISTDNMGNIYVTGYSIGNNTSEDYMTIKYSGEGQELWVARYNGPVNDSDIAKDIAVDNAGNIYVTGDSCIGHYGIDQNIAINTIKYDLEGNQIWAAQYSMPNGGEARSNDIIVDKDGNIYITGSTNYKVDKYNTSDAVTIKYDKNGKELWVAHYNSPEKLFDGANALVVDNNGNVITAGSSASIGGYADFITIKYNSEGKERWYSRYNSPKGLRDVAIAIASDEDGNVYVTGYAYTSENSTDFVTIKYPAD